MSPGTAPVGDHWSVACQLPCARLVFLCTNPPKYHPSPLSRDPHGRKGIKVEAGLKWFQPFWYKVLFTAQIFKASEIKACQQIPFAQCWENLLFTHRYRRQSAEVVINCYNDTNIIGSKMGRCIFKPAEGKALVACADASSFLFFFWRRSPALFCLVISEGVSVHVKAWYH